MQKKDYYGNMRRKLFIGLGGAGVRTLNRLKKEMTRRMKPGWERAVKILALDCSDEELCQAGYLAPEEKLLVSGGELVRMINEWEPNPEMILSLLTKQGQAMLRHDPFVFFGWCRISAKARLYAPNEQGEFWDNVIVQLLREKILEMAGLDVGLDVYVIGGLGGVFGSGTVTEMPGLIRRALRGIKLEFGVWLNGVFFTPEVCFGLLPEGEWDFIKARGYAALKELNYYQGISMREGFAEAFPSNDPEHPVTILGEQEGFYDFCFLLGAEWIYSGVRNRDQAEETFVQWMMMQMTMRDLDIW